MIQKVIKFSTYLSLKNSGNIDSDFDGLYDWEELELGTNPFVADTDGDGIKDGKQFSRKKTGLELMMLKDMFVAHEGNGYHPHALKTGRLFYHGVAAITLKIACAALIILTPIEAWLATDFFTAEAQQLISLTNKVRTDKQVEELNESPALDQAAVAKIQDMIIGQYFSHVSPVGMGVASWLKKVGYDYSVAGENLALGFSTPEEIIRAWVASPSHYANLIDKEYKEVGLAMASGNFEGQDVTFVAQFFGNKATGTTPVLATQEKYIDAQINLTVVERPTPDKKLVRADAVFANPVERAEVLVGNQTVILQPTSEANKFSGTAIFDEKLKTGEPLILATLRVIDKDNQVHLSDIEATISSFKPTYVSEYKFLRTVSTTNKFWNLLSGYYAVIILIALGTLLFNLFMQVKRQKTQVIASTAGLIGLLLLLIAI